MSSTPIPPRPNRRLIGLAATVALHLLLLWSWRFTMPAPGAPDTPREAIEWINVKIARPTPPKQLPERTPSVAKHTRDKAMHVVMPAEPPPAAATATPVADITAPPISDAPATPTAAQMLEQAKRDIGKFDKELRREFATKGISKPTSSPQQRLAQGIEDAYDAVPPKWYESAKVKEIIDPGQYGRKRYKITTAFGTYCMTYESPNSPTAQLDIGKRAEPKMTNCPPNEQAPTVQKW